MRFCIEKKKNTKNVEFEKNKELSHTTIVCLKLFTTIFIDTNQAYVKI